MWSNKYLKILEKNLKSGDITVQIDNLNDLWILYNVISPGDQVQGRTYRRVVMKEGSKGERKPMFLKLKVEDVAFHEFSNRLRVKGTILEGPSDYVSYGSYHTFNIEVHQQYTIIKEEWSKQDLKRLRESSKFESNFLILFVAIETGLATISLTTNYSHNKIATIKKHIPGKRYQQSHRNKAYKDFFEDIRKVVEQNLQNNEINLIIICGPGNARDHFITHLKENSQIEIANKIRSIHASSGTESAILETLKSRELEKFRKTIKILKETEKIEKIFSLFSTNPDLIAIGIQEVAEAAKLGAVKELLLVDIVIRGVSKEDKLQIEEIITNVEDTGGSVLILSSEHPTGKQIKDLGKIVAILRYNL
ncbi:MAG: mRNA surveillance protein pelota [Candidatus Lokiarchaeota archaeon]|nr:mRNA surveillance protein pelota [Candidatus Lokiarchaeota archaeon]MBD3338409.1 mRNA surveillance protein pelota [Candidatus Lokiarchaeota archaeon]